MKHFLTTFIIVMSAACLSAIQSAGGDRTPGDGKSNITANEENIRNDSSEIHESNSRKTEKDMKNDNFSIIRDTVINDVRHITAIPDPAVCSKRIDISIKDGIILEVVYQRGCQGNLKGIGALLKGMTVEEAVRRLKGIDCNSKGTSCPDQLARILTAAYMDE